MHITYTRIHPCSSWSADLTLGQSYVWLTPCPYPSDSWGYGPLTRYEELWVAHAPGMPGTFSPPPRFSDLGMHQGTCVTHMPWCMPGSLTCGFLWFRWQGKHSRHYRRIRNPRFYVSGKRPMGKLTKVPSHSKPHQNANCLHNCRDVMYFCIHVNGKDGDKIQAK